MFFDGLKIFNFLRQFILHSTRSENFQFSATIHFTFYTKLQHVNIEVNIVVEMRKFSI
jgi:hypothetical protein